MLSNKKNISRWFSAKITKQKRFELDIVNALLI